MATALSDPLQTLLRERLTSPEQIAIVLMLRKDPSRSWTAPEVASAVKTPQESAAMRLFLLASTGLIAMEASATPRYRFTSPDPETARVLAELDAIYDRDPAAIASFINAPAPDPIKSFSEAFRLKK